jgi:hypothetical protein
MTSDDFYAERRKLTFEQAEGVEPLPSQLQLKEISPELSARLFELIHNEFNRSSRYVDTFSGKWVLMEPWMNVLLRYHIERLRLASDEFISDLRPNLARIKKIIFGNDYTQIFGFLQFALRTRLPDRAFIDELKRVLLVSRAAYAVVENDTIVPITSEAEGQILIKALSDLSLSGLAGAKAHLKDAAERLTSGEYASSIRESIHSVESVARWLAPSGKLGEALAKLEASVLIHGALKSGFSSIYGYTSDEKGIRHALIDEAAPKVDQTDAIFMLGACAAFDSYLIGKARSAGLLKSVS